MVTPRRKCDDENTAVRNLERILRDSCQNAAVLGVAQAVQNPPMATKALEAALKAVATPPLGHRARTPLMI